MDVRESLPNDVCHSAGPWLYPLEHGPAIDTGLGYDQALNIDGAAFVFWIVGVLSVSESTLDDFLKHPSTSVWLILQNLKRLVRELATNHVRQRAHFSRANPSKSMC